MGSANKVASGVAWSMAVNLIKGFYGFISVPILINFFGKGEYGLIGLALSINVYMQLMDMGFSNTNLRFFANWMVSEEKVKVKKLFQTSLAFYGTIGLINAFILLLLSFFTPQLFHLTAEQDIILKKLLYILSVSAVISWYSSCFDQLIKATENVAWIQRRTLLPQLGQIAVLFITIIFNLSIEWFFFLTISTAFIIIPMSVGKIRQEIPFVSFVPKFNWPILKETLPYALSIFSFSIFQFSYTNLQSVFLGVQGTVESVADYRVIYGIIGAVSVFSSVFMGALLPSTARVVAQGNEAAYYRIAYDATKYISIVLSFFIFSVMLIGEDLLTVYVGSDYLYLLPWLNIWLIILFANHNQAISSIALSGTKIKPIAYSSAVASLSGLTVSWFLIPKFQVGGVVFASLVYNLVQQFFWYFIYWPRYLHINSKHVFIYSLFPYAVVGFIVFLLLKETLVFDLSPWWTLFIKGGLFTLMYGAMIFLMLNKSDKQYLISLLSLIRCNKGHDA